MVDATCFNRVVDIPSNPVLVFVERSLIVLITVASLIYLNLNLLFCILFK